MDSGEIGDRAVGTGPLILGEATQSERVNLDANPDFWIHKPFIDAMENVIMPDQASRLAAFRAGQVDYAYSIVGNIRDLDALLGTNPDIQVHSAPIFNNTFTVAMNLDNPKFQDERIRRGLNMAIDKNQIIDIIYDGLGKNLTVQPWTIVFDEEPTLESGRFGDYWAFDPDEARAQLAAAGAEDLELDLIFYNYSDSSNSGQNEILVDQLRQAGITLNSNRVDYTEFNSQWVGASYGEIADGWVSQGHDADNFFFNIVHSESPANRWHINDPDIDSWAEQQKVELDPEMRRELQTKIWDRMVDQMYTITKPTGFRFDPYQPWLKGMSFSGALGSNSFFYDWGPQVYNAWLDK